jgi:formate hydrogenlyase subunit 3/multisubunit Na+/H+ antiporter MnhD subunit
MFLSIDFLMFAVAGWLLIGLAGLALPARSVWFSRLLFPLGALIGLGVGLNGLFFFDQPAEVAVLVIGLPDLPFHLRLDSLSALFVTLLGLAGCGITLFAAGYFRPGTAPNSTSLRLLSLEFHMFLASMLMVLLADDAYAFMVAWELMALSSYFLVTTEHDQPEIRRAGFLYLLIAHVGAVALLLCFGVLQGGGVGNLGGNPAGSIHAYTFDAMRQVEMTPYWASVAFLLALFGFGAKAGLVPLHVWLPEAHPAAPAPVSALMSGVMLKTAIYGLLRVSFDLLNVQLGWWGVLTLTLGLLTALYGVIFAAVQSDMKRLLAWSSIENIGILLAGFGLTLIFHADGKAALAALALTAMLYHALNHAFFKGLLFAGAGAVLHATGERNMDKLGGLIRLMPWTAWLTLIGALAIAGLPPLNGFVSEWLLLQAFLFTPGLSQPYLNMVIPVAAAVVALAAALAAYVMVKFFGVTFLGVARSSAVRHAHEAGWRERLGMLWLAAGCILLGLFPTQVIAWLAPVVRMLSGHTLANDGAWFLLAPVDAERASYAPLVFFAVVLVTLLLVFIWVRRVYHGRVRRADAWDCGYPEQDARMQDTAQGFGQPIRHIFELFMRVEREEPDPFDRHPRHTSASVDKLWFILYQPIARLADWLSRQAGRLQHGRIQWYLIYSFATLIFLLVFVTR